jgi:hypothetical protein
MPAEIFEAILDEIDRATALDDAAYRATLAALSSTNRGVHGFVAPRLFEEKLFQSARGAINRRRLHDLMVTATGESEASKLKLPPAKVAPFMERVITHGVAHAAPSSEASATYFRAAAGPDRQASSESRALALAFLAGVSLAAVSARGTISPASAMMGSALATAVAVAVGYIGSQFNLVPHVPVGSGWGDLARACQESLNEGGVLRQLVSAEKEYMARSVLATLGRQASAGDAALLLGPSIALCNLNLDNDAKEKLISEEAIPLLDRLDEAGKGRLLDAILRNGCLSQDTFKEKLLPVLAALPALHGAAAWGGAAQYLRKMDEATRYAVLGPVLSPNGALADVEPARLVVAAVPLLTVGGATTQAALDLLTNVWRPQASEAQRRLFDPVIDGEHHHEAVAELLSMAARDVMEPGWPPRLTTLESLRGFLHISESVIKSARSPNGENAFDGMQSRVRLAAEALRHLPKDERLAGATEVIGSMNRLQLGHRNAVLRELAQTLVPALARRQLSEAADLLLDQWSWETMNTPEDEETYFSLFAQGFRVNRLDPNSEDPAESYVARRLEQSFAAGRFVPPSAA